MTSKRSHEGYFMLDHRDAPALPDEIAVSSGLPVGSGRGLFEAPTYTCSHCHAVVVLNPKRTRERAYCKKCDHYVCDGCGALMTFPGYVHRSMKEIIDDAREAALKSPESAPAIILPT